MLLRNSIYFIFLLVVFQSHILKAQTDTEFWFVAPEITASHGDTGIWLRLTTFQEPAVVTISQPANSANFADIQVSMAAQSSYSLKLTDRLDQIENKPPAQVNPYGIHITSTGRITVCYDETSILNTERFTLKGKNALGRRFFIPAQNYFNNSPSYSPLPYNSFDIVATEDSTRVYIIPTQDLQGGHAAGDTIDLWLMEGETYSCVATSQNPMNHLAGSVVYATKPIAVTVSDDSLEKNPPFTCADLIGDQSIPVDFLGSEYVIVRGYLDATLNDRVFVISAANSNKVYLNGTLQTTLAAGGIYSFQITGAGPVAYLTSDYPVYVYHVSGYGCELGDAVLPSIKCTGSAEVAFSRTSIGEFAMMIVTASGAEDDFLLDGSGTKIPASIFTPVPGTASPQLMYARVEMPLDSIGLGPHLITNSESYFSLGIINATLSGTFSASYGYFSDFSNLNLGPDDYLCPGSPMVLDAGTGLQRDFLWSTGATTQSITVTQPGTYWVIVNEHTNNCVLTDSIVLTGWDLPVVEVTGDTMKCQGESGTLTAQGGPFLSYLWNTGATTPSISYSTSGTYVVTVTNEHCSASDSRTVTVVPYLPVSIHIDAAPSSHVCTGTSVTFTATPVNGGTTPVYQWTVNGLNVGSDLTEYTYTPSNGDVIQCTLTSSYLCPSGSPAASNVITMTVEPYVTPSVSISGSHGGTPVCLGTAVTFTATPVNGGTSPVYEWRVNGTPQSGTTSIFTYSPADQDIVTCVMTADILCPVTNPVTSNAITLTVLNNPVSVTITSANNVCESTPVTFTANPVNGGSSPQYQWRVNGINAGTNDPVYTYVPVNGDQVTCVLTSNIVCPAGNPATAPAVVMVVIPNAMAGVTLTSAPDPVCDGVPVTFTAHPVNGGTAPVYSWYVNGTVSGSNNPIFSYTPVTGDVVTCQITSNYPCPIINQATSPPVNVYPILPVSVSITGSNNGNPICQGEIVTFTAVPVNGGVVPTYQWTVNGSNVGNNQPVHAYAPVNGDVIHCTLTSSSLCPSGNPASSNTLTMVVEPYYTPAVTIAGSHGGTPICTGTPVTFTATPVNGGPNPVYEWRVNGNLQPGSTNVFTYTPANHDLVTCTMTADLLCTLANPVTSNVITMTVEAYVTPSVTISGSHGGAPICLGTSVTFTATPVNGGPNPVYEWRVNGTVQPGSTNVFTYSPADQDVVSCTLTADVLCPVTNPVISNNITMTVLNNPVSVTVASVNNICELTPVTFTATPVNGGSSPQYQWQVNGVNAGTSNPEYTYVPVNGDQVTCTLTSNAVCPAGNPATSQAVVMVVNPNAYAGVTLTSAPDPVCDGVPVTFTAHPVNGGSNPVYTWYVNGNITGGNGPVYTYTPVTGDVVTCQITSNYPCPIINQATSPPVNVNPILPVSVSITGSNNGNPVCLGESVTFTAVAINGGTTPSYQWLVNGLPVGSDQPVLVYSPVNNDQVNCILTSSAICTQGNPATSNTLMMTVLNNPVSVSIIASANGVCDGTPVLFQATGINGGSAPVYRWKVNGSIYPEVLNQFTYTPVNNDLVSCDLTSNIVCPAGNPASSNMITMVVHPNLTAGVSIAVSEDTVCAGTPVTVTAFPVNGGLNPPYEWFLNDVSQGVSGAVFSFTPQNQDEIHCLMNSQYVCPVGNPAMSNEQVMGVHPNPVVTFTACTDVKTTLDAQPFRLTGGLPLGGTYGGPGVDPVTGFFDPALAGTGVKSITYTYSTVNNCQSSANLNITVLPVQAFTCGQPLTDVRDSKTYPTVVIGSHCWMASNLNYGSQISSTLHQRNNCVNEKYCWYDIPAYCNQDGGLYQWEEIMQYSGQENIQGLCPPGWHIPSENEWKELFDHFFNSPTIENAKAGRDLKSTGTSGFNATMDTLLHLNKSWNFDKLFSGRYLQTCCPFDSTRHHLHATFFWSSSASGSDKAWSHGFNNMDPSVSRYASLHSNAFYIRCRKD